VSFFVGWMGSLIWNCWVRTVTCADRSCLSSGHAAERSAKFRRYLRQQFWQQPRGWLASDVATHIT